MGVSNSEKRTFPWKLSSSETSWTCMMQMKTQELLISWLVFESLHHTKIVTLFAGTQHAWTILCPPHLLVCCHLLATLCLCLVFLEHRMSWQSLMQVQLVDLSKLQANSLWIPKCPANHLTSWQRMLCKTLWHCYADFFCCHISLVSGLVDWDVNSMWVS